MSLIIQSPPVAPSRLVANAQVAKSGTIVFTANTPQVVPFPTDEFVIPASMHNPAVNNTRIVAPYQGTYQVGYSLIVPAAGSFGTLQGDCFARIVVNGVASTYYALNSQLDPGGTDIDLTGSHVLVLNAGDFIEVLLTVPTSRNVGHALVPCRAFMSYLGPLDSAAPVTPPPGISTDTLALAVPQSVYKELSVLRAAGQLNASRVEPKVSFDSTITNVGGWGGSDTFAVPVGGTGLYAGPAVVCGTGAGGTSWSFQIRADEYQNVLGSGQVTGDARRAGGSTVYLDAGAAVYLTVGPAPTNAVTVTARLRLLRVSD